MEGYHLTPLHRETLHAVNPTNFAGTFRPAMPTSGTRRLLADLPRTTRGHPDLSDQEADTCVMAQVPPALAAGGAADYSPSSACSETPTGSASRVGLYFYGDHWSQDEIDHAVEPFERTMAEDKAMLSHWGAACVPAATPGRSPRRTSRDRSGISSNTWPGGWSRPCSTRLQGRAVAAS